MHFKFDQIGQILTKPTWPIELRDLLGYYFFNSSTVDKNVKWQEEKRKLFELVYDLYINDKIYISDTGPNDDHEREDLDTVVIHHSKSPDYFLEFSKPKIINSISVVQMLNLYANYFSNPSYKEYYNQRMYSGHYYKKKQTFLCYHGLIFPDGSYEQVLDVKHLLWHSYGGNGINRRSVAICLVGDFSKPETSWPTNAQLDTCRELVIGYQGLYRGIKIMGHREVVGTTPGTTCPGLWFLDSEGEDGKPIKGWKSMILP